MATAQARPVLLEPGVLVAFNTYTKEASLTSPLIELAARIGSFKQVAEPERAAAAVSIHELVGRQYC